MTTAGEQLQEALEDLFCKLDNMAVYVDKIRAAFAATQEGSVELHSGEVIPAEMMQRLEASEQTREVPKCDCIHGDSDPNCKDPNCPNFVADAPSRSETGWPMDEQLFDMVDDVRKKYPPAAPSEEGSKS